MRMLFAMAAVALAATPVQAGKYACTFRSGSSVIKQCDIASGTPDRRCVHPHSPTLQGACYVDPFAGGDRLQCVYGNGTTNIDDLTKAPAATADVGPLAEQPGFIAGGVTTGPPATLVLIAGYRENTSATLFQVLCTPKR